MPSKGPAWTAGLYECNHSFTFFGKKKNHRLCIGLGFIQGYNVAVRYVSAGCFVMMQSHCHSTAFILPKLYDYEKKKSCIVGNVLYIK